MTTRQTIAWTVLLLLSSLSAAVAAERMTPDEARRRESIRRGVSFLRSLAREDGTFQAQYGNRLGGVALAGLALRESGVPPNDPLLMRTATFVRRAAREDYNTYDLALSIMFLDKFTRRSNGQGQEMRSTTAAGLPRKKTLKSGRVLAAQQIDDSQLIVDLGQRLLDGQGPEGTWNYTCHQSSDGDHSNTQFAALGVWIAGQHGLDVAKALNRCADHFRDVQSESGGWGYRGPGERDTMTCAGLMCLAAGVGMKAELAAATKPLAPGRAVQRERDRNVEAGLRRLEQYLEADNGPQSGPVITIRIDYYYLWSVERVGVLFGTEKIGRFAWYPWGLRKLLLTQHPNGSWSGQYGEMISTSFALLFLNRSNVAPELSQALTGKFGDGAGMKAYRSGDEAKAALEKLAKRGSATAEETEQPASPASKSARTTEPRGAAGPNMPAETPLASLGIGELIDTARGNGTSEARQAALAELARRKPEYDAIKDRVAQLCGLAVDPDEAVAQAARDRLAEVFRQAPMSECLSWLGRNDDKLSAIIWEQVDRRIADDAERDECRKAAASALRENPYNAASKQAALDLLGRIPGDASVGAILDVLLEVPPELWPKAGETLKKLTGEDFGPHAGDGIAQAVEAEKRWRAWRKR